MWKKKNKLRITCLNASLSIIFVLGWNRLNVLFIWYNKFKGSIIPHYKYIVNHIKTILNFLYKKRRNINILKKKDIITWTQRKLTDVIGIKI